MATVFIVQGAAGKFLDAGGVDAVILPVAVAAEGIEMLDLLGANPLKELIGLVAEAAEIDVVISFGGVVRADHGGGGDEDFEGGITLLEGAHEPLALGGAPEGFFGAIGHFVWGAVVAAFGKPELQVAVDAVGAVAGGGMVACGMNGHLLAKDLDAGARGGRLRTSKVGVVEAEVVIVFGPEGWGRGEEIDEAREAEGLVPFFAEVRQGFGGGFGGVIIINDVARADEEVGFEVVHRGIGREAELSIFC